MTPKLTPGQAIVLNEFENSGPMTDERLVERVEGLSPSGSRSRRAELVELGLLVDTGHRVQGKTGRQMVVWGLAPAQGPAREPEPEPTAGERWKCAECGHVSATRPPDGSVSPQYRIGPCSACGQSRTLQRDVSMPRAT